jgi:hypothetical protein
MRKRRLIHLLIDLFGAWDRGRQISQRRRMSSIDRPGSMTARRYAAAQEWKRDGGSGSARV